MFIEMLCEPGRAAISSESMLVFVVTYCEISPCLSHIGFLQSGHVNLYTPDEENLTG